MTARNLLLLLVLPWLEAAQDVQPPVRTEVLDPAAASRLEGEHPLTLQWIGWDKPGSAEVTRDGDLLSLRGSQRGRGGDYLEVVGAIERVEARSFVLVGSVATRVSHIAGGRVCRRQGRFHFRMTGKRRYWRLAEMDNPCDGVADYVDVYLR